MEIGEQLKFGYTGKIEEIQLEVGKYQIEAWGASGGSKTTPNTAGKGAYSLSYIETKDKLTIKILVGEIGSSGSTAGGGGGGSQTAGGVGGNSGSLGQGGDGVYRSSGYGGAGGGGYYGGGGATPDGSGDDDRGGGGGSGYIGGVINGQTIVGNDSMPSPSSDTDTQIGQSGNGCCIITCLSLATVGKCKINNEYREMATMSVKIDNEWRESVAIYVKINNEWKKSI